MGHGAGVSQVGPLQGLDVIGDLASSLEEAFVVSRRPCARDGERHAVVGADERVEHHAQADRVRGTVDRFSIE